MSTFKPRHIKQDNNITPRHPLKEVAILLCSIGFFLVGGYILLGYTLESMVSTMSIEREQWLWNTLGTRYIKHDTLSDEGTDDIRQTLQDIIDSLPNSVKPDGYTFKVHVLDDQDPNAFAMPGGNIAFTTGLIELLDNENAITFVLGHEIGHFANRDHLRGMGHGLAAIMIGIMIAGQDSGVVSALTGLTNLADMAHSRAAEDKADLWGLKTLEAHYGHVGGATLFFEKLLDRKHWSEHVPTVFSTHPDSEDRINTIKWHIKEQNLPEKPTKPFFK